jgi:hypothetical protein
LLLDVCWCDVLLETSVLSVNDSVVGWVDSPILLVTRLILRLIDGWTGAELIKGGAEHNINILVHDDIFTINNVQIILLPSGIVFDDL